MLSEALRLLRVFHDLKQNDLAERLDLSKSYLSEIENGKRTPSLEVIQKYADFFKIPMSSILFFSEQLASAETGSPSLTSTRHAIASKVIDFLKVIEQKTELNNA